MNDDASILIAIGSTAVGSIASWFTSRWYYRRSSSDLDNALRPLAGNDRQLIQATNAIAHMLDQAGLGKPTYDAAGNLPAIEPVHVATYVECPHRQAPPGRHPHTLRLADQRRRQPFTPASSVRGLKFSVIRGKRSMRPVGSCASWGRGVRTAPPISGS